MIEPKPGSYQKWLPASKSLGGGQENLFFHADVTEKPGSKLLIRSPINLVGMSHSRLKQLFKPPVVFYKKVCERSCLFVLSWVHLPSPIMSLSEGERSRERNLTQLTSLRVDEGLQWNTSLNSSSIAAQDFLSASALYSRASIPALPASGLVNPCLTPG